MLRGARRYDPQRDSIIYATNYPFSKDNYVKAGLANEALFRFCRNMCKMKVDNAEYALITAIVIFSDREEEEKKSPFRCVDCSHCLCYNWGWTKEVRAEIGWCSTFCQPVSIRSGKLL